MKQTFVEYYDIKDDPVTEYYVEKLKQVADNERFQRFMNQFAAGSRKGGYRYGLPKTKFGFLLQSLQVKLKPIDRREIFEREIGKIRDKRIHEQSILELLKKLSTRSERICPQIYDEISNQEEELASRLENRKAQKVMHEVRAQLGDLDLTATSVALGDSSPLLKRITNLTFR